MTDEQTIYRIPAVNYPRLEEEIAKLNKRAKRLKTDPITVTVVGTENETRRNEVIGFDYEETYYLCIVEGEAPKLEGWTLVAALEPAGDEVLLREVPGQRCPNHYRTVGMDCDHCAKKVKRNKVYVLRNDFGEYKQVGSTCVADFLGHTDPKVLMGRAEYMISFDGLVSEAQEEGWGGSGGPICVSIDHFVAATSVIIRKLGWLPRSQASDMEQSTADTAWMICTQHDHHVRDFVRKAELHTEPEDLELARAAVKWASEIDPVNAPSTYLHDLGVACRQAYVTWKLAGYTASVIQAYKRHLEQELKRKQNADSQHVGEIGERMTCELTIVGEKDLEPNQFGPRTLVTFVDGDGNILKWFTGKSPRWVKIGEKVTLAFTVKKHDEFQGKRETVFNRPKVQA